jgi:hypothetical protein
MTGTLNEQSTQGTRPPSQPSPTALGSQLGTVTDRLRRYACFARRSWWLLFTGPQAILYPPGGGKPESAEPGRDARLDDVRRDAG